MYALACMETLYLIIHLMQYKASIMCCMCSCNSCKYGHSVHVPCICSAQPAAPPVDSANSKLMHCYVWLPSCRELHKPLLAIINGKRKAYTAGCGCFA
jgi:hypothetical protein